MVNKLKVLVIDDNEAICSYLQAFLEAGGYQVVMALDGREGLEVFNRETPDIILVDLRMPDMDGLAFIAEINKKAGDIPLIVISGTNSLSDAIEATRLGAWDFLTKPFNEKELEFSLGRCLERARLLDENHRYREHLEEQVRIRTRELQESSLRYRRLLESVTNYVYTVIVESGKPVKTIHHLGCDRITGYTLEEYRANPGLWYRIVHEDDRAKVFGMAQHILAGTGSISLEHRIRHKDGSIRWLSNTLVPNRNRMDAIPANDGIKEGALLSYDGIMCDITGRKRMEESLRNSETRYRQVFENNSDSIFIMDVTVDGRFLMAEINPAAERATGLSSAELSGTFIGESLPGATVADVEACLRHCVEAEATLDHKEEIDLSIGRGIFHTTLIPLRNETDRVDRIIGIARDFND